jgi:hypothetical protein
VTKFQRRLLQNALSWQGIQSATTSLLVHKRHDCLTQKNVVQAHEAWGAPRLNFALSRLRKDDRAIPLFDLGTKIQKRLLRLQMIESEAK